MVSGRVTRLENLQVGGGGGWDRGGGFLEGSHGFKREQRGRD